MNRILYGASLKEASRTLAGGHEGLYFAFEFTVCAAGVPQECGAFLFRQPDCRLKQIIDFLSNVQDSWAEAAVSSR